MSETTHNPFHPRPDGQAQPGRRDFFRILGGGILVLVTSPHHASAQPAGTEPKEISAWLHIGEDGTVTVFTGKVEVGQNIRTSLAQAVADELDVEATRLRLVMGDTALVPFDMGTFGSRTTPFMAPILRRAAAAARQLLVLEAARRWQVAPDGLQTRDGRVLNPANGRSLEYGELARGRRLLESIESADLKSPARWTASGRNLAKVNGRDIVTGSHRYPSDMVRPGMWYGRVLRPPTVGASLVRADLSAVENRTDLVAVREGDFLGLAAPDPQILDDVTAAVRAEWKTIPQPSRKELFEILKKTAKPGNSLQQRGSLEKGFAEADIRLEAAYRLPYIAHVPLEPRAAVAEWEDGKLTVWTGSQRPFGVRSELARAFGIPEDRVRVIIPDTGSGYGGKHTGEAAIEAARLSRAAGKPVKVVWTREEEFRWAYFRPAALIEVKSGIRKDGALTAWEFYNYNSGPAAIQTPYDAPHQRIAFLPCESPLRQGSYRALAATANHFARESHMDELAHAAGMDPLDFRLKNTREPRLRAVFETAAERIGYGKKRQGGGSGIGMGGGYEKLGYTALFAEISAPREAEFHIERIVIAFECGAIVNPKHLESQVLGCVVMGLGGALFEEIDFTSGRIRNARMSLYRVPRFSDVPRIEVVLLNRKEISPGGAGETPIVGVAPAIANALFQATGKRLRDLPLRLSS